MRQGLVNGVLEIGSARWGYDGDEEHGRDI